VIDRPHEGPISIGQRLKPRIWPTLTEEPVTVPTDSALTHIQFRRFAGCPVCNLHLRTFINRKAETDAAGIREVIVFHSARDDLRKHESDLPFHVIPDPDKILYREFGVESSKDALRHPTARKAIVTGVLRSALRVLRRERPLPPLNPGGGRLGLPADFLVRSDGLIVGVHYGQHSSDQWSVDEVLALAHSDAQLPQSIGEEWI